MASELPVERVYRSLREKIVAGHYSPSQTLVESALATEYGVSRNTAKKAILMLEQDGLLTVEHNKSAKVRSFSKKEVMDFLAFRQVLEGFIVRMAVPCFTQEDLAEMDDVLEKMRVCKDAGMLLDFSRYNQQWHNKIFDVCPNRVAADVTANLKAQMRKYNTRVILLPGRAEQSHQEHCAILDAIKRRQPKEAEEAMCLHLAHVLHEFEENYDLII